MTLGRPPVRVRFADCQGAADRWQRTDAKPARVKKGRQLRGLRHHRDVARRALEIGAMESGDDLEAIRDALNGWYVGVVALRQASHTRLAAIGAPQFFVPLVGHRHGPG